MKKIKKIVGVICLSIALALILPLISSDSLVGTTAEAATMVKLNKTKATLVPGDKLQLKLYGTKDKITWSSSKKSVVTVSSKGKVAAKKVGNAKVTAKCKGKKYTCTIKVKKLTSLNIKVKALSSANSIVKTIRLKITNNDSRTISVDNGIFVYDFSIGYAEFGYSSYLTSLPDDGLPLIFGNLSSKKIVIKPGQTKVVSIVKDKFYFKGNSNTYYQLTLRSNGNVLNYTIYPETNEGFFDR